ncbi:MAG: META domain-containing protein, partial [Bacteroidetes bacterium]|nr:META domain-containing protein [Fibrella sp.]
RLRVPIEPTVTRDNVLKRDYAYTVRVESGGRRYVGWGAFIKGSERLNGVWTLESFRGQRLHAGQFADKKTPTLDIDLKAKKLRGSTGYNILRGDVTAEGDHLQLLPDAAKRRTCPTSFEADFLTALRKASLFRIGKDRLTLLADGQYVMTWRKMN